VTLVYCIASNVAFARRMAIEGQGYATCNEAQADLEWIEGITSYSGSSGLKIHAVELNECPTRDGVVRRASVMDTVAACVLMLAGVTLPAIASLIGG
jgi:hypothetical protein